MALPNGQGTGSQDKEPLVLVSELRLTIAQMVAEALKEQVPDVSGHEKANSKGRVTRLSLG